MANDTINELELIRVILSGETALFSRLIDAHKDRVFNFIYRLTGNYQEAEDITQEAFITAFQKLNNFKIQFKFTTWLFTIARNIAYNHLKRRNIVRFFSLDKANEMDDGSEIPWEFADTALTPEQICIKKEEAAITNKLIQELDRKYREIFLLRYQEDLSYTEIAEITGLPLGTVEIRLHRAAKQLARKYKEMFSDQE